MVFGGMVERGSGSLELRELSSLAWISCPASGIEPEPDHTSDLIRQKLKLKRTISQAHSRCHVCKRTTK